MTFSLWGYFKELVYKPLPANLPELKEKVRLTYRILPESMVARAVYGMKRVLEIFWKLVEKSLRSSLSDCNEIEDSH